MLRSPAFLIPVLLGMTLPWVVGRFAVIATPIAEVVGVGMTYAALGFGACVTGAVLAISLPGPERVRAWAQKQDKRGFSTYGDLVFSLTWSAFAQLGVAFVCITSVLAGGQDSLLPQNPLWSHRVLLGLALAVILYAITQLMVLVQTISQLGNLIDFQERLAARVE